MSRDTESILYLCRQDVEQICSEIDSVAIIRAMFSMHGSGQTILPDEAYLGWKNAEGESVRSLNMPGYVAGSPGYAGTKIINGNIANPKRGLPRASGLTLLYDPVSVRINCIMEGAFLSSLRTASVTALAVELLQGGEISCLALIGAGVLAQAHIELLAKKLPRLQLIRIYDTNAENIETLKRNVRHVLDEHNIAIKIAHSAEEAIRAAQLIVPVTTTTTAYICYEWLQPGAVLVNVSLDDALPEVALHADAIVVDDWNLVKNDPRRLLGRMYREGKILGPDASTDTLAPGQRRIDAQLGEIVTDKKIVRRTKDDIIFVNPFGLAIEDIALAMQVYQKAIEMGFGIFLAR